jgi:signal recognition particle receptor subunit beta
MDHCKIVFTGPMGAGKTTAIGMLSDTPPISTETSSTESSKASTTAAFDYGECRLADGTLVRLFGTPGQLRFDFMWEVLSQGAIGIVVLVDDRRPDPAADALDFLTEFPVQAAIGAAVVGLGRFGAEPGFEAATLAQRIQAQGYRVPVVDVDVRRKDDVQMLLQILVAQLEVCG